MNDVTNQPEESDLFDVRTRIADAMMRPLLWLVTVAGLVVNLLPLIAAGRVVPSGSMPREIYAGFWILLIGGLWFLEARRARRLQATFLVFLGLVFLLAGLITIGPLMGTGTALAMVVVASECLLGRRASLATLLLAVLIPILHLALLRAGQVPLPAETTNLSFESFQRTYLAAGMCNLFIWLLTRFTIRSIEREHRLALAGQQQIQIERESRYEAEHKMQAMAHFEALGRLAGGVAHDVNNSLTAVLCSAEMMKEDPDAPDRDELVADIISASRNAAHTTRQLLSLNRRSFCHPQPTRVGNVLQDACRLARRLFPENIAVHINATAEIFVLVDSMDLQQALLNLLINARDAMPQGGTITLGAEVHAAAGSGEPRRICLSIVDTGGGIPESIQSRLFEPFVTTKARGKGTGLGLSVVKAFVEEAGGNIAWRTEQGVGTRFELWLPETSAPDATAPAGTAAPFHARGSTPRHVLLVEDQTPLRVKLSKALERGGFTVTAVSDAESGLLALHAAPHLDLLCTDGILTGGKTSGELVQAYNRRYPQQPVLVISGHVDETLVGQNLQRIPHSQFLRKPFSGVELLHTVRKMLD